ncbi:MAG: hypothetical protein HQM12_21065 [SAR324 cluster bacterium]|nr:hypothetical protein [SAR324 cluster bacterium]
MTQTNTTNRFETLTNIRKRIDDHSMEYIRTTPVLTYPDKLLNWEHKDSGGSYTEIQSDCAGVEFDMKDILFIGAITQCTCLILGGTGEGKTTLAKRMMEALYGKSPRYQLNEPFYALLEKNNTFPSDQLQQLQQLKGKLILGEAKFWDAIGKLGITLDTSKKDAITTCAKQSGSVEEQWNYYNKTTLPSMSTSDFMDIDFKAMKEGTLRESIKSIPALELPGIILNEVNRAPAPVQALLIPFLDNEFELEGKPVPIGHCFHFEHLADIRYQFCILSINETMADVEQSKYTGIEKVDKAIRDRAVIELPIDMWPQRMQDVEQMLRKPTRMNVDLSDGETLMKEIAEIGSALQTLPVDDKVYKFLIYLTRLNNCIKSPTGTKIGIAFTPHLCEGCHHKTFYRNTNACGSLESPSPRAIVNLLRVGRGFALIRAWKQKVEPKILCEDILMAAPFVFYNKIGINHDWLMTNSWRGHTQTAIAVGEALLSHTGTIGSRWLGIKEMMKYIYARFQSHYTWSITALHEQDARKRSEYFLTRFLDVDPWSVSILEIEEAQREVRKITQTP